MTPNQLSEAIGTAVREGFDASGSHPDLCIHIPDKVAKEMEGYFRNNPSAVMFAFTKAAAGDRSVISELIKGLTSNLIEDICEDIVCLPCRLMRLMDRTRVSDTDKPNELDTMATFLGRDVMESLKWVSDILEGTINSKKSSDSHRKKAEVARNRMLPSLMASAAMVHDLQIDLIKVVKERDKYHNLADLLADEMSDT